MSDTVREVKEKLDIVDFIRGYIQLVQSGKNFKANCPFHSEKTPSFMVSSERQSWHCFGCSTGGDIFSFLMKFENLEFYEALKVLSEKAGIELKRSNPQEYKQFGVLYDINNFAKEYYKKQLEKSLGDLIDKSTANYLLFDRGLTQSLVNNFDIGLSGNNFDALTRHLISLGSDINDIVRSGLAFKNERGLYQDRFRNRIMFPIMNTFGKVVGFTGRILPNLDNGQAGKYVNSPETPIFIKSKLLFGLHKSKKAIRDSDKAFIVEGPMDFLMSLQDGVENVVATMGTALTLEHLKLIKRLTNKIALSFDNDSAGWSAAERAIDLGASMDFDIEVVILKEFKDAADLVRAKPGILKDMVTNSRPAMDFYFEKYAVSKESVDRQNIRKILLKIKNFLSPVEKGKWLKILSNKTGLTEDILLEELDIFKDFSAEEKNIKKSEEAVLGNNLPSRKAHIAERLVTLALAAKKMETLERVISFMPPDWQEIKEAISFSALNKEAVLNESLVSEINLLHHKAALEESNREVEDIEEEMSDLVYQLEKEQHEEKRKYWSNQIRLAEARGDEEATRIAMNELSNLPTFDI